MQTVRAGQEKEVSMFGFHWFQSSPDLPFGGDPGHGHSRRMYRKVGPPSAHYLRHGWHTHREG